MKERTRNLLLRAALVVATLAVYAQTARFDWVGYDDDHYVTANPVVLRGLDARTVAWAFTSEHGGNWHPLTGLSHMLDVELFGTSPAGPHLVNALLHVVATLLLFELLTRTTARAWPAFFVAGVFALHPLHVESVAWISERKDVLSTALAFAALLAWTGWTRRGGAARYTAALALYLLALAAKPMVVTLPCVMLLLDLWPLGRLGLGARRLVLEKLPFLAAAVASSLVTIAYQPDVELAALPFGPRAANAVVSYARYLGKAFWPAELGMLYPHPNLPGGRPWTALEVGGAALLLVAITLGVAASRRRYAWTGWLLYLGTLVPVIGLVHVGSQAMADRYAYVPLVGVSIALAWAIDELVRRDPARAASRGRVACAVGLAALAALGAVAYRQARTWRDSIALFEQALLVAPRSPIVHGNLGNALLDRGRVDEAERHYRRALELQPSFATAHVNLGNLLQMRGDAEGALAHYGTALELDPADAHALVGSAQLALAGGDAARAEELLLRALAAHPDLAQAETMLAGALVELGRRDEARARLEHALELDPGAAPTHFNLGLLALQDGDRATALAHLSEAVRLDPDQPAFAYRLAWMLATDPDPAVRQPMRAVMLAERASDRVGQSDPWILDAVGAAYAAKGDHRLALEAAERARELAERLAQPELARDIAARIELYRAGRAFVDG